MAARERWATFGNALLFLGPALLLYVLFVVQPTAEVIRISFFRWDGISPEKAWVGLRNYQELLTDKIFWEAFSNNIYWTAIIVVINVFGGLVLASLLAQKIRGRAFFQVTYFLPVIQRPMAPPMPASQPSASISPWLGDFTWALPALAIAHAWSTVGLSVVIFVAGLPAIDPEAYEAAKIDGAGEFRTFLSVMLPLARPAVITVALLEFLLSWNDLLLRLVFLTADSLRTLTVGLLFFQGTMTRNVAGITAAAVIMAIPIVILFLAFQRQFMQGMIARPESGRLNVVLAPHFRRIEEIFSATDLERLRGFANVIWAKDEAMPSDEIARHAGVMWALVTARPKVDRQLLASAPKLKAVIEVAGRFPDEVDYDACFRRQARGLSCAPASLDETLGESRFVILLAVPTSENRV